MRSTGRAVTETEAAHHELIGPSEADCSLTGAERSLIKVESAFLSQRSHRYDIDPLGLYKY
jgi:hypothetical protein